jgi:DNA-binding beta-propeller fold protein YncE
LVILVTAAGQEAPLPVVRTAPRLPLAKSELPFQAAGTNRALGMVSSVAMDRAGTIYVLQRGTDADPVIAMDRTGRVLRSWGKGLYQIPHSIRIAPDGSVWTVDAQSSAVYRFTPEGRKTLEIRVGGQPACASAPFCGATDIAFGPNGRLFVSDGYGNARVIEYSADGRKVREFGTAGRGPGQFRLPHAIQIDEKGVLYVADRENARIQRFDLEGRYLGEWTGLGRTFSLRLAEGGLYIGTQQVSLPNGAPGWLMRLNRTTGAVEGLVESTGHHSVEVTGGGELLTGSRPDRVLWFRKGSVGTLTEQ